MFAVPASPPNRGYDLSANSVPFGASSHPSKFNGDSDFLFQTDIAQKVSELGGVHKYDLTPDVTHLVVGDYDTPKYRHVARERSDIKAMDAAWIEEMSELWKNDDDIDYVALEAKHQLKPLETCGVEPSSQEDDSAAARGSLFICLTGFGDQRDEIAEKIRESGGRHTGDLTRRCSHLIVSKPEGKKFNAAKAWNIYTVTLDWLLQSIERGLILEEKKFDPMLAPEEQGVDAWIKRDLKRATLGKRSRSAIANGGGAEDGVRKLRKTASMKLNSQRNNLWGDILGRSGSREYSFAKEETTGEQMGDIPTQPGLTLLKEDQGVFSNCTFVVHGFGSQRTSVLEQTIVTLSGSVVSSLHDPAIATKPENPDTYLFLIVPQASQPDTHPQIPHDSIHVITEYYIENCLHTKRFFSPNEQVLGRPFPLFPIPGFSDLTICSAAFTGIELNQVARSIVQLGARFEEEFRRTTSVLVCKSLDAMRKEKLRCALDWGVPIVTGDWLWECISTGYVCPMEDFTFPVLRNRTNVVKNPASKPISKAIPRPEPESKTTTKSISKGNHSRPPAGAGVDPTAFDRDSPEKPTKPSKPAAATVGDSVTSADFMTARTHPVESFFSRDLDHPGAPLAELSSAALNKSPKLPVTSIFARTKSAPIPINRSGAENPVVSVPDPSSSAPPAAKLPHKPSIARNTPFLIEEEEDEDHEDEEREKKEGENEEEEEEAARRRKIQEEMEAEKARQQASAAKVRQGLTTALSDLIHPISGLEVHEQDSRPRRRHQRIFGRAISNASNASSVASGGGEGTSGAGAGSNSNGNNNHNANSRPAPESLRAASAADHDDDVDNTEPQPPPGTQLEYRDPAAMQYKAMLMSRMAGEPTAADDNNPKKQSTSGRKKSSTSTAPPGSRTLRKR